MDTLNILHIASFSGNIGDNANHIGFKHWLKSLTNRTINWTEFEIRQFYWKEILWDNTLVDLINSYDALVIGGGNYFELWVDDSPTGTSIAIDPELWAKIRVPVYFNALGVDPGQGVPDVCRKRFHDFLDTLLSDEKVLVSVRNDGAKKNLAEHISVAQSAAVLHAPDNGFFAEFSPATEIPLFSDDRIERYVTINLASDMADVRFGLFADGAEGFANEIASALGELSQLDHSVGFLFAPHIFRDLDIINGVINKLPDRLRRTRVAQTPYGTGDHAARTVFSYYAASDVCVGTRFHANVVPLGCLRQTLGLVCYPQISALYEECGQKDRCIDVSSPGFSAVFAERVLDALDNPNEKFLGTPQQAFAKAKSLRDAITPKVKDWLSRL